MLHALFSLNIVFTYVDTYRCSLFILFAKSHSIEWQGHSLLVHSSVDGHLSCFQSFCIAKKILPSSCYLSLGAHVWVHFCIHLDSFPKTRQKAKLNPWFLKPSGWVLFLFQSILIVHGHLTTVTKISDLTVWVWPHPSLRRGGALSFMSPEHKSTITSLHWDLYTFQVLKVHSVTQVSFENKNEVAYDFETRRLQLLMFLKTSSLL